MNFIFIIRAHSVFQGNQVGDAGFFMENWRKLEIWLKLMEKLLKSKENSGKHKKNPHKFFDD